MSSPAATTTTTAADLPEDVLVYSPAQLARAIDRSPQYVLNAIKSGALSAKRNSKSIFIFPADAVKWIKSMDDA